MMKKIFAAREFARPCRCGVQRFHDVTNLEGGGPDFPRHCEPTGRANARPMTGSAKQSTGRKGWIASSLKRSSQ
jgi:hypothetical protein